MNFEDILKLVEDTSKTKFQLAADLHALISKATAPSALKVQPIKERAKRGPNKPKTVTVQGPTISRPLISSYTEGADDHAEAH